jgi:hypothetical protein
MPEKTATNGQRYSIDGRTFIWTTDEGDHVRIPMRIKLKVIRALADRDMSAAVMFELLENLIPDQADVIDEMDLNDFQSMFVAWQAEYEALSGASLGE